MSEKNIQIEQSQSNIKESQNFQQLKENIIRQIKENKITQMKEEPNQSLSHADSVLPVYSDLSFDSCLESINKDSLDQELDKLLDEELKKILDLELDKISDQDLTGISK